MVVEPESFCWGTGREVQRRDGETWAAELRQFSALEYAVTDAGKALEKGLRLAAQQRPCLHHGLDVFHPLREEKTACARPMDTCSGISTRRTGSKNRWTACVVTGRRCSGTRH